MLTDAETDLCCMYHKNYHLLEDSDMMNLNQVADLVEELYLF